MEENEPIIKFIKANKGKIKKLVIFVVVAVIFVL